MNLYSLFFWSYSFIFFFFWSQVYLPKFICLNTYLCVRLLSFRFGLKTLVLTKYHLWVIERVEE